MKQTSPIFENSYCKITNVSTYYILKFKVGRKLEQYFKTFEDALKFIGAKK